MIEPAARTGTGPRNPGVRTMRAPQNPVTDLPHSAPASTRHAFLAETDAHGWLMHPRSAPGLATRRVFVDLTPDRQFG